MTDVDQSPAPSTASTGVGRSEAPDGPPDREWRPAHELDDRRDRTELLAAAGVEHPGQSAGVALLGVSLVSAFALIMRLVFGGLLAVVLVGLVLAAMAGAWVVLPRVIRPHRSGRG